MNNRTEPQKATIYLTPKIFFIKQDNTPSEPDLGNAVNNIQKRINKMILSEMAKIGFHPDRTNYDM